MTADYAQGRLSVTAGVWSGTEVEQVAKETVTPVPLITSLYNRVFL